jgi:hypothetical protein
MLFAMAVFTGITAAAVLPARMAAASEHGSVVSSMLTPAPPEPEPNDYLSRAMIANQHQAAAAAQPPTLQDLIRNAFQPLGGDAVDWAEKIAWCESKYDSNAVNSASNAQGLFQFLPSTWAGTPFAGTSPFDPNVNAQAAAWLYQKYGPTQWECVA